MQSVDFAQHSDKVFSDPEADSAAHMKFELLLSGSDNCFARLFAASVTAREKMVIIWLVFAAS